MADATSALLRLSAWLSPAFPVGSFSYSSGLETAAHSGLLADAASLGAWVADLVESGSAWNDAVLLAEAHRLMARGGDITGLARLGEALAGSLERHRETMLQGAAFLTAAAAWPGTPDGLPADCPYPVAVGMVAAANGVGAEATLALYLQSFATNQLQAAIRLSLVGQSAATAILAGLEATIAAAAGRAAQSTLDDLGSATMMAEITAMQHETHYSRLFRS